MKPRNFPARKLARQQRADPYLATSLHDLAQEIKAARAVRTKITRKARKS